MRTVAFNQGYLNSFTLKLIAMFTMVIDHIGYGFFPYAIGFRIIGRIALPIFAFLLAEGFVHTHNRQRYLLRLALFAAVSEPFFDLFCFGRFSLDGQNIFFTLALAFCALLLYERVGHGVYGLICVFGIALVADFLLVDYGWYGIVLVFIFYKWRGHKARIALAMLVLALLYAALNLNALPQVPLTFLPVFYAVMQIASLLALPFILAYNGKLGYKMGIWVYMFYPVHMFILYAIPYVLFLLSF